jgi:hypothetical protein
VPASRITSITGSRISAAGSGTIGTFPALGDLGPLRHRASVAGPWRTATGLAQLVLRNHTPLPVLDLFTRDVDVFHASVMVRRPPRRPLLTATLHDMTCWLMPELHPHANLRDAPGSAELLRRADRLIAVSAGTKMDAARVLGIAPHKITVIHSGIAPAFFASDATAIQAVRARYGF